MCADRERGSGERAICVAKQALYSGGHEVYRGGQHDTVRTTNSIICCSQLGYSGIRWFEGTIPFLEASSPRVVGRKIIGANEGGLVL